MRTNSTGERIYTIKDLCKKWQPQIQQKTIQHPTVPVKQLCPRHEMGIVPLGRLTERLSQNHYLAIACLKPFVFLVFNCEFQYHANGELWLYLACLLNSLWTYIETGLRKGGMFIFNKKNLSLVHQLTLLLMCGKYKKMQPSWISFMKSFWYN